jgi:hypothetical protein
VPASRSASTSAISVAHVRPVEHVEDVREPRAQLLRQAELLVDPRQMPAHGRPRVLALADERRRDLLQREAHAAQRQDAVQATDVRVAVYPDAERPDGTSSPISS